MLNNFFYRLFWILIFSLCLFLFVYINFYKRFEKKLDKEADSKKNIALFVPGIISASPSYKEIYDTVVSFEQINDVNLKVFEAGFEQNEWADLLDKLLSSKKYDFLITMNNSMQYLLEKASQKYPDTKFLLFDSFVSNSNPQIYSLSYNVAEEAYILGYYVGLFLDENNLSDSNVALISGQKYPIMTEYIEPYFRKGINEVVKSEVLFRVLGNWYDSNKAKSISDSLIINSKVKVILPIVGSAVNGVLSSIENNKIFAVLFDSEEYLDQKNNIIGSGITNQDFYVKKILDQALNNKLKYGSADIVGLKEDGVSFNYLNKFYLNHTSNSLKKKLESKVQSTLINGISIEMK